MRLIGWWVVVALHGDRMSYDGDKQIEFALTASGRVNSRSRQPDRRSRADTPGAAGCDPVKQAVRQLWQQDSRVEVIRPVENLI